MLNKNFSPFNPRATVRLWFVGFCLPTVVALGQASVKTGLADYLELDPAKKELAVKNFDVPETDIKDVVVLISQWTGKNFIIDKSVSGKITILGPTQVTVEEAYRAFLVALAANNLTTVKSGKFIRVIRSGDASHSPVETFAGAYAPRDEQFITRIFQLKYINSREVEKDFRELITKDGKIFAYEPTNTLIVTDTGSNIARVREILDLLDVKNYETTLHLLPIKNGSVKAMAELLSAVYGDGKNSNSDNSTAFAKNLSDRRPGGGMISKVLSNEETNSLVILSNPAGFDTVKKLVEKLDIKTKAGGNFHIHYCEFSKAEDLAAILAAVIQNKTTPAETKAGIKITSDSPTNSIVAVANANEWKMLKEVIRKLDIPRIQVFVQVAIFEVGVGDSSKFGVNVGLGAPGKAFAGGVNTDNNAFLNLLRGTPGVGGSIPIFAGPSFPVTVPVPGVAGQTANIVVNSFMGLISLASINTNTSLLSTPQILALDNQKAEFQVVDEIPVQTTFSALAAGTSAGLGGTAATPTGNIDSKKVGIVLKLTPHVNPVSRMIRLEIEQKIDNVKKTAGATPSALKDLSITTTSRIVNTTVIAHDQDYIMLGGLRSDKVEDVESKVPLLGDIPILGWLFKTKSTSIQKTNLVVLLQPRIINSSVTAARILEENFDRRDKFLSKYQSGQDAFGDEVDEIRTEVRHQRERENDLRRVDYENSDEGR
jgi:general secretion pathway protein D